MVRSRGLGDVYKRQLDEAGVAYTAARTDFMGSFDPQGNAVMIAAATGFASRNIDTLLAVTSNVNLVDIQLELAAQGVHPRFISVPIAKNAANELFADAYGTQEVADGMEYVTFTTGSTELDDTNPIAKPCHEVWTRRTGEVVEPNTFDYQIIATPVSYTHLRAHATVLDLVCRLLLSKKTTSDTDHVVHITDN